MRVLARALLEMAAFLELSGKDVLDPDAAVKALESLASGLAAASPAEREVLASVAQELSHECASIPGFQSAAAFYSSFMQSAGLEQGS